MKYLGSVLVLTIDNVWKKDVHTKKSKYIFNPCISACTNLQVYYYEICSENVKLEIRLLDMDVFIS